MKKVTLILLIILSTLCVWGASRFYQENDVVEKKETVKNAFSISVVQNWTIILEDSHLRKEINFVLSQNAPKEDTASLINTLQTEGSDRVRVYQTEEEELNVVKLVIDEIDLKDFNEELKSILGENNNIEYEYKRKSLYQGKSYFSEETDLSELMSIINYQGNMTYGVFENNRNLQELQINKNQININGTSYHGQGKETMQISFVGSYVNYWSITRRCLQGVYAACVLVLSLLITKKYNYIYKYGDTI